MPFENSLAHAFTAMSIRAHAPAWGGIYGISNRRQWIFIGAADNIQHALLNHLQERDSALARSSPTGFVFELAWPETQSERCRRLITEYAPACNGPGLAAHDVMHHRFTKERR